MGALSVAFIILAASGTTPPGDYARWNHAKANADGRWTSIAEAAVRKSGLPELIPSDITTFCPAYEGLTFDERTKVWTFWMSAIAEMETKDFNPHEDYVEESGPRTSSGEKDVSLGLFQLSPESASNPFYGCGKQTAESLHDAKTNIQCAASTFGALIKKDGVVGTREPPSKPTGAAKVFGTLWPGKPNHPREFIIDTTRSFSLCRLAAK